MCEWIFLNAEISYFVKQDHRLQLRCLILRCHDLCAPLYIYVCTNCLFVFARSQRKVEEIESRDLSNEQLPSRFSVLPFVYRAVFCTSIGLASDLYLYYLWCF